MPSLLTGFLVRCTATRPCRSDPGMYWQLSLGRPKNGQIVNTDFDYLSGSHAYLCHSSECSPNLTTYSSHSRHQSRFLINSSVWVGKCRRRLRLRPLHLVHVYSTYYKTSPLVSLSPFFPFIFGRTSTFSRALTHSIVTILLAGLLPSVGADCSVDRHGNGHCTLSVAAHAGLGVVLVLLLVAMAWYMRYRRWRATQIYISNAIQNELNVDNGSGRVYYLLETK
ncbi:hypothetical protein H4582DRAFT_106942 [Lactarius indigo]|nr:hypothetical protein H4582DRAFT_106942 [Lactarius indigo]